MSEVSQLLQRSKSAHEDYRRASGRADSKGVVTSAPNYPLAEQHVAAALEARLGAHALDPDHTDPAWGEWQHHRKHEALVAFYRKYPTIP